MSEDIFKTVAFTSMSNEVKQSLITPPESEDPHFETIDSEEVKETSEEVKEPSTHFTVGNHVDPTQSASNSQMSGRVQLGQTSTLVPSSREHDSASLNTSAQPEVNDQNTSGEQAASNKQYDRFNRTIDQSSLELFEDPKSTGVAWMIRDQDDAIEHRDRLMIDNSDYYRRNLIEYLPYVVIIVGLSIGGWLFYSSTMGEAETSNQSVKLIDPSTEKETVTGE